MVGLKQESWQESKFSAKIMHFFHYLFQPFFLNSEGSQKFSANKKKILPKKQLFFKRLCMQTFPVTGRNMLYQEKRKKDWSWKCSAWKYLYCWYGQISPEQMLPGQMSWWHLKSVVYLPMTLCLKFDPSRASTSWDIADMDKCPQDKCCLDKCRGDSCNLLYMFPGPFV